LAEKIYVKNIAFYEMFLAWQAGRGGAVASLKLAGRDGGGAKILRNDSAGRWRDDFLSDSSIPATYCKNMSQIGDID
jgi:hypothetical protein